MRKETDLARVKMIAHVLLDMPIAANFIFTSYRQPPVYKYRGYRCSK